MARPNRNRCKRTIYLGDREIQALDAISRRIIVGTKAAAIRFAILETARRFKVVPRSGASLRLVKAVKMLHLLPERDKRMLDRLCAEVEKDHS